MAKRNAGNVKGLLATAKRGPNNSSQQDSENASTLSTPDDSKLLMKTKVPAPVEDRVFHGIAEPFSPRMMKLLMSADVRGFFGNRLKPDEIAQSVQTTLTFEAISQRMSHSAAIAQRIAAPAEVFLLQQAALIVDIVPDYLAENPGHEDEFADLLDWWSRTFPGGGPKPANKGNGSENPAASGTTAPADSKKKE